MKANKVRGTANEGIWQLFVGLTSVKTHLSHYRLSQKFLRLEQFVMGIKFQDSGPLITVRNRVMCIDMDLHGI